METAIVPVETILKEHENEFLIVQNQKVENTASSSTSFASDGNQCIWTEKTPDNGSLVPESDKNLIKYNVINPSNILLDGRSNKMPLFIRSWPPEFDSTVSLEQKLILPTNFSQQFSYNIQSVPVDENYFLQFDYKTRNKLKTKQRRLDPYYRNQERVRQRTVMRIKRQDPRFRAAEREKGRSRMRIKRLDPVFRSQERERQRERMKLKRSNPDFREKEREQQKLRLNVRRSNSLFKAKAGIQDQLSLQIRHSDLDIYATSDSEPEKFNIKIDSKDVPEIKNKTFAYQEEKNPKLTQNKCYEQNLETFHFKKQKILNFNFYNCNKEQWDMSIEKSEKINELCVGDNIKCETLVADGNRCRLDESESLHSRNIKHDLVPKSLMDIKAEVTCTASDENLQKFGSSDIPSYSFTSVSAEILQMPTKFP